ncbi:polysaccharide deacetylase family protein [Capnocytophaga haemolytica]
MSKHFYITLLCILTIGITLLVGAPFWMYIIIVVVYLGLLSWGVFDIRLSYFVPTIYHLEGRPKRTVALTFDDGPSELTPLFLDTLKKYNTKAVFFCIGAQIEKYPDVVKRIIAEGHLIGNHTYSHTAKNTHTSTQTMIKELEQTDIALKKLGITTALFRPPYGITNPQIASAAKRLKKKVIGWDIRSLDTMITNEDRLLKRITRKLTNSNIILMHDRLEQSLHTLERLLQYLSQNQYTTTNKIV